MLITHLPSGYILAKVLEKKFRHFQVSKKAFFATIMFGAVFPDLDLLYFYFFDSRSVHHHKYFLHWFSFWLVVLTISIIFFKIKRNKSKWAFLSILFCNAAIMHLILDGFVGDIWLFAPFIDKPFSLFNVPSQYDTWWLNFIFHWSFSVEILICLFALYLYFSKSN
ncbi:metal-dependent hydrolase [Acinetobacter stercoris]|uniref:Metal-dependent hydrolase n=1 Tax=Acinetobacter stercoris TaxID=2126983 RepID=A0A2U3N4D5_9GAMM|nr:metal-dependent hydrolase [Acinetobacter stercoris]SPL72531.1 hypothetical protein KPC_3709 [Acinetobacter stercoris]